MSALKAIIDMLPKLTPKEKGAAKVLLQDGGEETAEQAVAGAAPVAEEAAAAAEVIELTLEQALAEIKNLKTLNEELQAKLDAAAGVTAEEETEEVEEETTEVAAQAGFVAEIQTYRALGYFNQKTALELQGKYFKGAPKTYLRDIIQMAAGKSDKVRLSKQLAPVGELGGGEQSPKTEFANLFGRLPIDQAELDRFKEHTASMV